MEVERRIGAHFARRDLAAAATEALRGYGPGILGWLVAVRRDREEAREAFGIFSEELWRSIGGFRGASTFKTWAYRVAWRALLRLRRDGFRRRARPLDAAVPDQLAAWTRSVTARHLVTAVKDRVARLRERLTGDEQALLVLRVDRDMSWGEIADVLGGDAAALRKRYERVKHKLRRAAEEDGLLEDR
jgi:RNA polymerase sigma-70 factor, ECF subfamily